MRMSAVPAWAWVLLLFLFLTVNPLLFQSFWENEAKYILTAKQPLAEILRYNAKDQSPVYFIFLHYWMNFFGSSEFALRLPSVLFGLLAIFFLYPTVLLVEGRALALISSLFLALSPLVVGMAQEVKHWTFFLFLSILTVYFLVRYLRDARRSDLAGFFLASLVNLYTCFFSFANSFAIAAFLFSWKTVRSLQGAEEDAKVSSQSKELFFSHLLLGLAALPQLFLMRGAVDFVAWQGAQWGVPSKFPDFFLAVAKDLIGFSYRGPYAFIWLGISLLFLTLGIFRSKSPIVLFAFFWIIPLLLAGYHLAEGASIRERYFITLIPMLMLLVASGILALPWKPLRFAAIFLMAGLAAPPLRQYYASHRQDFRNFMNEDWRGAIQYLEGRYEKGDVIVLIPRRVREGFMAYSGLPFIAVNQYSLDQFLHYRRVWILSIYRDRENDPAYPLLDFAKFSNIWLKLYDLHPLGDFTSEPTMGSYDFHAHLKNAKGVINLSSGRSLPYSVWQHYGLHLDYQKEIGSWGEGLLTDRWEPKKDPSALIDIWRAVAVTHQESGGKLRPVLWAHPVEEGPLILTYPEVPMDRWLLGFHGLTDYSVTQGQGPVEFKIQIAGETVHETLQADQHGWSDFAIATDRWKGTTQTVSFTVFAGNIRWRHFCFNAWVASQKKESLDLRFVGDVMLSRGVAAEIKKNNDALFPFHHVKSWLGEADLAFANLENAVADSGEMIPSKDIYFRADPRSAPALAASGLDVFSLANNHVLDYGSTAAMDTVRNLQNAGLDSFGLKANPNTPLQHAKVITRKGVRIAFLGYSFLPTSFVSLWPQPFHTQVEQVKKDVPEALRRADIVVVSAHLGLEYSYKFEPWQHEFARAAIDAGAHIFVGTHPHTVQEVERYKHGIIFYSLGDFVFDMPDDWRRLKTWPALAAEVDVTPTGQIKDVRLHPLWINERFQPEFGNVYDAESLWVSAAEGRRQGYRFSDHLASASLRSGQLEVCKDWKTDRIPGPVFFQDRWACLGKNDFGVTRIRERSQGAFRDGLFATLETGTQFELEYSKVPFAKKMEGFFGWTDHALTLPGERSVELELFVDDRKIWSAVAGPEAGWKTFEVDTKLWDGKNQTVLWRIKNLGSSGGLVFDGFLPNDALSAPAAPELKLIKQLSGPDILRPKSVRISPDGRFAYVQNLEARNTLIFDTKTLEKIRLIAHEGKPVESAFTQNGRYLWISYLALIGGRYPPYQLEYTTAKGWDTEYRFPSVVVVYDTEEGELIHRIPVGVRPKFLAATPDEKYVLVSNWSSDSVSVMDTKTFRAVKEIKVRTAPRGIAFSKDSRLAYVSCMRAKSLAVIDLEKLEVVRWIEEGIGEGPRHLVRNKAGDRLYISANWSSEIEVLDLTQEKVIQRIPVGDLPRSIVLSPDETWLFVDNYGSASVSVVDLLEGKEAFRTATAEEPVGMDVTPDGRQLWVTHYRAAQVSVFETRLIRDTGV